MQQDLEDKKMIDAGQLDELLLERTDRMRGDFEGQRESMQKLLDEANGTSSNYKTQLEKVVIDSSIQTAVGNVATVKQGAMQDVLSRAKSVWKLDENGAPLPVDHQGKTIYGKDGSKQVSMEEWAEGLLSEAPYLFEGSKGGGAGGGDHRSSGSKVLGSNQEALSNNLEDIAAGKVEVSLDQ